MLYGLMNVQSSWSRTANVTLGKKDNLYDSLDGRNILPKSTSGVEYRKKSATCIVIFTGILIATRYTDILDVALVPLLNAQFSNGHRFQQDNDPKHTSRWSQEYFRENEINWFRTPASSPDLNPIENVWGTMKEYLRTKIRPRDLASLKYGIRRFWKKLTPATCSKYIDHIPNRVISKVIEVHGEPSGF